MPPISCCRSCGGATLEVVLDLGSTPLANALRKEDELSKPETVFPLILIRCASCSLLQITENVPANILFSNYFYRSSFSDSFLKHCKELATQTIANHHLSKDSLVIDIASNDGYLLQYYKEKGIPVLGIEPATNIAAIAAEKGIETLNEFFTSTLSMRLSEQGKHADVLHAHNVLPHVADQRDFMKGVSLLLKPKGIAIIECAYALDTIDKTEFDQIYHEHMCYFSLTSLQRLVEQCGLVILQAERIDMHGGSLRAFLGHAGAEPDPSVQKLLDSEQAWGVDSALPYQKFADRTETLKKELVTLLQRLKSEGKRIAVYGASAKGATLMNFCGIDSSFVDYIVDRSTVKQGHYSPGTQLKIEPVEKLLADQPDYVLLLTWNFADEILEQQNDYRSKGGKFIVPIPSPTIL